MGEPIFLVQLGEAALPAPQLTKEEAAAGVEVLWLGVYELMDRLENYPSRNLHGSNIHTREFLDWSIRFQKSPAKPEFFWMKSSA
ncbi:MAG: hypothetical protein MZU97_25470 [Bacillus subtilis]|nr:hypothetical protein [Bacillus subtilis]